jgi:hypothetical protein
VINSFQVIRLREGRKVFSAIVYHFEIALLEFLLISRRGLTKEKLELGANPDQLSIVARPTKAFTREAEAANKGRAILIARFLDHRSNTSIVLLWGRSPNSTKWQRTGSVLPEPNKSESSNPFEVK